MIPPRLLASAAKLFTATVKHMRPWHLTIAILTLAVALAIFATPAGRETSAQSLASQDRAAPTPTPTPIVVEDSPQELFCFSPCAEIWKPIAQGLYLDDLSVEVVFINPTQTSGFAYGIILRNVQIKVFKGRVWQVIGHTREVTEDGGVHYTSMPITGGRLTGPFNTEKGGENHLRVTAVGDQGCLFVNGEFVSCFDISGYVTAGNVEVASTHGDAYYKDFVVQPALEPIAVPTSTPAPIPTAMPTPAPASIPTVTSNPAPSPTTTPLSAHMPTATPSPDPTATPAVESSGTEKLTPTPSVPQSNDAGSAEDPTPVPEIRRGFFINSTTAVDASGFGILLDPLVLTLIGLAVTLLATGIQLFKGS